MHMWNLDFHYVDLYASRAEAVLRHRNERDAPKRKQFVRLKQLTFVLFRNGGCPVAMWALVTSQPFLAVAVME